MNSTINLKFKEIDSLIDESISLSIQLKDHPAVKLWLARLIHEMNSKAMLRKDHLHLGYSPLTLRQMVDQVNACLDAITSYDYVKAAVGTSWVVESNPYLPVRLTLENIYNPDGTANEELLNEVHNYFPMMSGPAHRTSPYMYVATPEVRSYICRLNLAIHELQTSLANDESNVESIHLNLSWQVTPTTLDDLDNSFNELFSKTIEYGDVYLGYPQVGKTHMEAFFENDEALDEEHVEPIKKLSGDFLIHLSNPIGEATVNEFNNWLISKGLPIDSPENRYGFCILGKVINPLPNNEMASQIRKFNDLVSIEVQTENELIAAEYPHHRFSPGYEAQWIQATS
jgi:hypothetical protein